MNAQEVEFFLILPKKKEVQIFPIKGEDLENMAAGESIMVGLSRRGSKL